MVQGQSNIPTLILLPEHLQQIGRHGEATYPEECCGLVLGKITPTERIGVELWKTENSWSKQESFTTTEEEWGKEYSKRNRFTIAPREMLRAQKEARNRQLQIMGIYHSHPDGQPVPSECDRRIAWPEYSYLIVAVCQGKAGAIQSWILDDNHQFQSQSIVSIPLNPP